MIQNSYKINRLKLKKTETVVAKQAGISRITLRQVENGDGNPTLETLNRLSDAIDKKALFLLIPKEAECASDVSIIAVSIRIAQEGFENWPYFVMELVDEFRKLQDPRLLLLPPTEKLDKKLRALLASITVELCKEAGITVPDWAVRTYFLPDPWFVSEMESLKASAILESPLGFRRNNIFVQSNFLKRA